MKKGKYDQATWDKVKELDRVAPPPPPPALPEVPQFYWTETRDPIGRRVCLVWLTCKPLPSRIAYAFNVSRPDEWELRIEEELKAAERRYHLSLAGWTSLRQEVASQDLLAVDALRWLARDVGLIE